MKTEPAAYYNEYDPRTARELEQLIERMRLYGNSEGRHNLKRDLRKIMDRAIEDPSGELRLHIWKGYGDFRFVEEGTPLRNTVPLQVTLNSNQLLAVRQWLLGVGDED